MSNQEKLYRHDFRPVYRSLPSQPEWQPLKQSVQFLSTPSSEGAFVPLDRYLSQFGIANLPPLSVEYSNGSSTVSLHGNATVIGRKRDT